jgi:glycosyltransferase involved in cell wall biosynthesis
MPPRRRVVVVSYYHAPVASVGARRWDSMAAHLRAMGHDVTVVTSAIHGRAPDDAGRVVRTADLGNSVQLRRLLRRPGLPVPGVTSTTKPAPAVLTKVLPPDSYLVSWAPMALMAVARLVRSQRIDCIITSGPPDSTHLVALALGRLRPAWIADFRDGWRFEPLRDPWPTRLQTRVDALLERRVARAADVVVGATAPIAEDFATRCGANAHWVSNGFEPEAAATRTPEPRERDWRTLVHTGTLSGPRGRDPRPFLNALRAFDESRTANAARVRLVLAGGPSADDRRLLAESALDAAVHHVGLLERGDVLALQRDADALLLLTGKDRSEATGKLFEYLASGRPIIALAQDNEAARIVRETRTGVVVDGGDPAAIHAALKSLVDGSLERDYAPHDLDRFRYPGPAAAMADLVEEALARRAAGDG